MAYDYGLWLMTMAYGYDRFEGMEVFTDVRSYYYYKSRP